MNGQVPSSHFTLYSFRRLERRGRRWFVVVHNQRNEEEVVFFLPSLKQTYSSSANVYKCESLIPKGKLELPFLLNHFFLFGCGQLLFVLFNPPNNHLV